MPSKRNNAAFVKGAAPQSSCSLGTKSLRCIEITQKMVRCFFRPSKTVRQRTTRKAVECAAGVWDQRLAIACRSVPKPQLQNLCLKEREEFGSFEFLGNFQRQFQATGAFCKIPCIRLMFRVRGLRFRFRGLRYPHFPFQSDAFHSLRSTGLLSLRALTLPLRRNHTRCCPPHRPQVGE